MQPLVIPMSVLESLACSAEQCEESPRFRPGQGLIYPEGWTQDEAERLAVTAPGHLFWLAQHRLVPMNVASAIELNASFVGLRRRIRWVQRNWESGASGDESVRQAARGLLKLDVVNRLREEGWTPGRGWALASLPDHEGVSEADDEALEDLLVIGDDDDDDVVVVEDNMASERGADLAEPADAAPGALDDAPDAAFVPDGFEDNTVTSCLKCNTYFGIIKRREVGSVCPECGEKLEAFP